MQEVTGSSPVSPTTSPRHASDRLLPNGVTPGAVITLQAVTHQGSRLTIRTTVSLVAVPPEREPDAIRARYTILVEQVGPSAFHLTVRELPETWTVAFDRDEIEQRARQRIALDLRCHPTDFDIALELPALFIERRADRRSGD
jgi:hypothetical protein